MKILVLVALVLYVGYLHGASNERIGRQCDSKARWAAEVFDLVTENPNVILNGMNEADEDAFTFIRAWAKDGKTREELIAYTKNHCVGVEV